MKAGRPVAVLRQQVELVKLGVAVEDLADAPHHALVDHAAADAKPVPELERTLGKADRARPLRRVGVVEQQHGLAALRQSDRKRQPDRPGTHHHHRMFRRIGGIAILIAMPPVAELDPGWLRHALTTTEEFALAKRPRPR